MQNDTEKRNGKINKETNAKEKTDDDEQ